MGGGQNSLKNLRASPFNKDLSNATTLSLIHLTGQYLEIFFFICVQEECPSITTVQLDLTDWAATQATLSPLPAMHGVVNNAAVAVLSSFLDTQPEDFDR
jgi:NAD(P)-dependent dehydrogenase (short-subunit alcohol dehydrogenase family)